MRERKDGVAYNALVSIIPFVSRVILSLAVVSLYSCPELLSHARKSSVLRSEALRGRLISFLGIIASFHLH
jgi:hypothetical protein